MGGWAASCGRFVSGVRQDAVVVSRAPQSARGQGEPQPFTHLSVPSADLYRSLLRIFARAKERFIVHLRPEDVAAELRVDADEQLTQALDQLATWGNLRADVDTSRVTTVEDFHRKRSLYQLSRRRIHSRRSPGSSASRLTTPWDPELATAMRHRNVRVEEELTLDALLQDLSP